MKAQLTKQAVTAETATHLQKQLYRQAFAFVIGDIADIAALRSLHDNLMVRRSKKIELYSLAEATCRAVFHERQRRGIQLRSFLKSRYAAMQIIEFPTSHAEHRLIKQIKDSVFSFMQSCIDIDQLQATIDSISSHDASLTETQILAAVESACSEFLADTTNMIERCDCLSQYAQSLANHFGAS